MALKLTRKDFFFELFFGRKKVQLWDCYISPVIACAALSVDVISNRNLFLSEMERCIAVGIMTRPSSGSVGGASNPLRAKASV